LIGAENSKSGYQPNLTIIWSELTKIWSESTKIWLAQIPSKITEKSSGITRMNG
jgi:hypothetical protein